jgi:hypothetical protein
MRLLNLLVFVSPADAMVSAGGSIAPENAIGGMIASEFTAGRTPKLLHSIRILDNRPLTV